MGVASPGPVGDLTVSGLEIVTIGTELLLGATQEGNGAWLGRRLAELGIVVRRRVAVPDDVDAIRSAIDDALRRTGTVICTGGLGPTQDDLTRDAVAQLTGRELIVDDSWVRVLEGRFRARGITMPAVNRVQAEVPEGARLLPNERGTAPGIVLEDAAHGTIILLPGVPHEMRWLSERWVLPWLVERGYGGRSPILSRTLRTTGIAESALPERLGDVARALEPLTLAFLPAGTGVDLRVTSWGQLDSDEAGAALARAESLLRERLAPFVYGVDGEDLAAIVGGELRRRGWTVALAESCTGGLVAKRLTDAAGSSAYVIGGVVAYANDAKRRLLGVRDDTLRMHGAVSERTAREMAEGVRAALGADCGVSITGIAGPTGGTEEKPVGTVWAGVALRERVEARLFRLFGDRSEIRERAAQAALAFLLTTLRSEEA